MKKTIFFPILVMSFSLVLFSFAKASKNNHNPVAATEVEAQPDASTMKESMANAVSAVLYEHLNLQSLGLSRETVEYAVKGYQKLDSEGKVNNPYMTIVDFSQSSRKKRLYIIDMKEEKLVWNTFVSHGKNSGIDMAEHFSNKMNSEASSLGFYITSSTYRGKHGLSLRISGQEEGFNDNAEARGVVVHGAPYVTPARVNSGYMGRSQGCPALPENEYAQVINIIKGGSVMFLYFPSDDYLQHSGLINS
jgi:hypothetical protein